MNVSVGFSTANNLISRIVRYFTSSQVSHAWLGFDIARTPMVLQANADGVVITSRKEFCKKNTIKHEFSFSLSVDNGINEILQVLGEGYDYLGLIGYVWILLGKAFKKDWNNPFQSNDRWYCSELVAYYLQQSGVILPCIPSKISPQLLLEILQNSPHAKYLTD